MKLSTLKSSSAYKYIAAIIFLFTFLLSNFIHAQQWVQTRGPGGGNVLSMLEKNGAILAATYGGIFRSTDNGDTWVRSSTGLGDGVIVETLAATDNYIYGGSLAYGLYKSSDNGVSWNLMNTLGVFISQLFASHDTLYVGCDGCGVYRSVNEAASFETINTGYPATSNVNSFAQLGPYLYTGLRGSGGSVGVYRTLINSINWVQVNNGLITFPSVIDIAVKGNDLLVTTQSFISSGMFRSSDYGNNWVNVTPVLPGAEYPTFLAISGNDMYFGTDGDAPYWSADNGVSWQRVNNGLKPLSVFSFLVGSSGLFVGYERGVARTTNNGANWERKTLGLTVSSITSLFTNDNTTLYATGRTWTVGSTDGVFFTTDAGQNWTSLDAGLQPSPQINTLTKSNGNIIIGTDNVGLYIKTPADAAFRRASGIPDLIAVTALISSGPYVLAGLTGNGELYRSSDYGLTWVQSNTGFDAQEDQVFSFCEKSGVIYAGAFNALYKSVDFGATWTMSKNGIYPGAVVTGITVLGNDLFASTGSNNRIYKSSNNGANWVPVNNGLPAIINFNTITTANGDLYAGSNLGVYKSTDSGNSWTIMNNGLLYNKTSLSLAAFNNTLFLGTDETAVWGTALVTLPITLENFSAKENNGIVNLYWKTSSEINGSYFDVQRSTDGQNFISIGTLNVSGSINGHAYHFDDLHPKKDFNYYRLVTVDNDGNKKYSGIVLINLKTTDRLSMVITPNPSNSQSTVYISGNLKGKAAITAYDVSGRMIANLYSGEINSKSFSTTLNLSVLKSGIYFLTLTINYESVTSKLIIE